MDEALSISLPSGKKVVVTEGDITDSDVDAIVNAANTNLLLGSGVAGAIRERGGEEIQRECSGKSPIPLGEAAVTGGGRLSAKYVIHAAGMRLGGRVSEESLRDSTKNSLLRAEEVGARSVAFPAIGTGVGGFPLDRCAGIMIDTVADHLKSGDSTIEEVRFVLFDDESFRVFRSCLQQTPQGLNTKG